MNLEQRKPILSEIQSEDLRAKDVSLMVAAIIKAASGLSVILGATVHLETASLLQSFSILGVDDEETHTAKNQDKGPQSPLAQSIFMERLEMNRDGFTEIYKGASDGGLLWLSLWLEIQGRDDLRNGATLDVIYDRQPTSIGGVVGVLAFGDLQQGDGWSSSLTALCFRSTRQFSCPQRVAGHSRFCFQNTQETGYIAVVGQQGSCWFGSPSLMIKSKALRGCRQRQTTI